MPHPAEHDPVVVEPQLTPEKIEELLTRGRESAKLDYKESFDPSDSCHRFQLTKHIVAMANTVGGYIVIGVEDDGTPVGLAPAEANRIDEATIRSQVSGSIVPSISIFVDSNVDWNGIRFVIITVLPHKERILVLTSDGQCHDGGRQYHVFREGDVFVRHGSASERWNQEDADFLLDRASLRQKEEWREEFREDFQAVLGLTARSSDVGPSAFGLSPEEFRQLILRLLRA